MALLAYARAPPAIDSVAAAPGVRAVRRAYVFERLGFSHLSGENQAK